MRVFVLSLCLALSAASVPGQAEAARTWPLASGGFLIRDVSVLPMTGAGRLAERDVRIHDGVLVSITAAGAQAPLPDETVIEGRGRTLLPGLVDMHVHVDESGFDEHVLLYLAHGVTTVQSMHGTPEILDLRARLARGELLGPRLFTTGPTTATEGVDSPAKARAVVSRQAAAGYDAIKMYGDGNDTMSADTHRALVDAAHEHGLRVVGHAARNMTVDVVLDNGQDSLDHMEELIYTARPLLDALLPLVRYQFQGGAHDDVEALLAEFDTLDLSAPLDEVTRAVVEAGVSITPTLIAFTTIADLKASRLDALLDNPQMRYVNPFVRFAWAPERTFYRDSDPERLERMGRVLDAELAVQKQLVRAFHEAGVPLMTGSDAPLTYVFPGWSLQREVRLLAESGMGAQDALRAATIVPARELGLDDHLGSVEVGKQADLLLVNGDPLADLHALADIAGVFTRGNWLSAERLQSEPDALVAMQADLEADFAPIEVALAKEDFPGALAAFASCVDPEPSLVVWLEDQLNLRAYRELREGRDEAAVERFAQIAKAFPESWNAWDSLGEGLAAFGAIDEAIRCYERSVELNPGNEGGRAALARLRSSAATPTSER
ncbi:MAG: hypothetical protein DHS20C15_19650 [Planctomycetota bacterium]|nr:MAG: hypothetical protein DHS20C15_19650 [Planctomycetota bacterium]